MAKAPQSGTDELTDWWMRRSRTDARNVVPKAIQYGPWSMVRLGQNLAKLAGREVTDEEAIEIAIWCYILGKIERWTDAVIQGRRPVDDIIDDICIYAMMARRTRAVGTWPGVTLEG